MRIASFVPMAASWSTSMRSGTVVAKVILMLKDRDAERWGSRLVRLATILRREYDMAEPLYNVAAQSQIRL